MGLHVQHLTGNAYAVGIGLDLRQHIFPWVEHPVELKAAWLNPTRFYVVQIVILAVLAVVTVRYLRVSVRPGLADGGGPGRGHRSVHVDA